MFFEATGIVRDTRHTLSGSIGATCHVKNLVKHELKCGPWVDTWHHAIRGKSKVGG